MMMTNITNLLTILFPDTIFLALMCELSELQKNTKLTPNKIVSVRCRFFFFSLLFFFAAFRQLIKKRKKLYFLSVFLTNFFTLSVSHYSYYSLLVKYYFIALFLLSSDSLSIHVSVCFMNEIFH